MINKNVNLEERIRAVLQEPIEPSNGLTLKVRATMNQGGTLMRRKKPYPVKALLIAIIIIMLTSLTAFAIWGYRPMDEIAGILANDTIANAFRSDNAIIIDKSQQSGVYAITLLGIAPVEELNAFDKGDESRTYAVLAISKTDGAMMPEIHSDEYNQNPFYAIPFINGVKPWQAGVEQIQGSTVIDGVLYILFGCDELEVFADREVYIGVSDRPFFSHDIYSFDEETGRISRNQNYNGVNALFALPLDISKADPRRADDILGIDDAPDLGSDIEVPPEIVKDTDDSDGETKLDVYKLLPLFLDPFSWGELTDEQLMAAADYFTKFPLEECTLIEDSVKTYLVDSEGFISYEYEGDGFSVSSKEAYSAFVNHPVGEPIRGGLSSNKERWIMTVSILSSNGEMTFMLYILPEWLQP